MPGSSIPSSGRSTSSYGLPSPIASTLAYAASFALPSPRSNSPSQASGPASASGLWSGSGSTSSGRSDATVRASGGHGVTGESESKSRSHDQKSSWTTNTYKSGGSQTDSRKKRTGGGGPGWHDEAWDSGSDEDAPQKGANGGLSGSISTVRPSNSISSIATHGRSSAPPLSATSATRSSSTFSTFNNLGAVVSQSIGSIGFGSGSTAASSSDSSRNERPGLVGSASSPAIGMSLGLGQRGRNGSYRAVGAGAPVAEKSDDEEDDITTRAGPGGSDKDPISARPIPVPATRSASGPGGGHERDRGGDRLARQTSAIATGTSSKGPPGPKAGSNSPVSTENTAQAKASSSHGSTSTISFTSSASFPSSYSPGDSNSIDRSGPIASSSTAAAVIGLNGLSRAFSYTHISPPNPTQTPGTGSSADSPSGGENHSAGSVPRTVSGISVSSGIVPASIPPGLARTSGSNTSLNGLAHGSSGSAPGGADWTILEAREARDAEKEYEEKGLVLGNGTVRSRGGMSTVTEGEEENGIQGLNGSGKNGGDGPSGRKEKIGRQALRADHEAIMNDPLHRLKATSANGTSAPPTPTSLNNSSSSGLAHSFSVNHNIPPSSSNVFSPPLPTAINFSDSGLQRQRSVRTERRREKFGRVLRGGTGGGSAGVGGSFRASGSTGAGIGAVDPIELRQMAWSGVPAELRPVAWQMLLNYLPLPATPRLATLARKRKEYAQLVNQTFNRGMTHADAQIWHQIEIDVPRTRPGVPLWACETTQRSLERILYVWAIRHPASGYVQGINDLVTPFFEVFLGPYINCDPELFDCSCLPATVLAAIEADTFWCMSKLLDGIQDNYISQQPGIHRLVRRMSELIKRIDAPLAVHMEEQGIEFMQFAFRWMNCLLMREISVKGTIRMWDTYLSEGTDAFSQFHLYVCSAFLVKWSARLQEMEFQDMIMFLQCLPTQNWTDHDIELLLSEAFVLKSVWQGAENHFAGQVDGPLGGGMGGR